MENNINYDIDYFINKFSVIPEDQWTTGELKEKGTNKYCAYGHCGVVTFNLTEITNTPEAKALTLIFGGDMWTVINMNDNKKWTPGTEIGMCSSYGKTPKERILNKLNELKNEQNQQANNIS